VSLRVLGLGTALPEVSIDQARAAEIASGFGVEGEAERRLLAALFRRSGVRRRHASVLEEREDGLRCLLPPARSAEDRGPGTAARMARYAEVAPRLALRASARALSEAALDPGSIDHLVTVSCTGFEAPGVDIALIEGLGLPPTLRRTHVGFMGCHGAINGLFVADAALARSPHARVLVSAVELCSLHLAYGFDPERVVPNALFADGAAALVGVRADASRAAWRTAAFGSLLFPGSRGDMTWRVGDHGFEMTLSARVPALIEEHLAPWLVAWLGEHGLALADVRGWAVHPGGPRVLDAVERALALPADVLRTSRTVLEELGNMSSPTVLFIVDRLRRTDATLPCVALGFGPGLVAEAVLFR
jgi:predicted naringenin-chalcone synthase